MMTNREKKLGLAVVSIGVLLGSYLLIEFFVKESVRLQEERRLKSVELGKRLAYLSERELWEKRASWAKTRQPAMTKPDRAGPDLLVDVRQVASKVGVQVAESNLDKPDSRPQCTAALVNFEVRGSWQALCSFLKEMQEPERFVVFESAQLQVDSADKTQMKGVFRVAKWYAPR
jgi:hypothetical protein